MDPELEVFLRRPSKTLQLQQSATLDDTVTCLAVTVVKGQQLLAVGQADGAAIAVMDEGLTILRTIQGHRGGTNSLSFGPDGKLVSAGEDGTAAVWDAREGNLCARLECEGDNLDKTSYGHTVSHVVCSPDGALAACAAGRTLHVFEIQADDYEANRRVFPPVSGGVIEDVRFVGSGRVACAYYGGITIHSTEPGTSGLQLEYGTNVMSVAATKDLSYVVGGCMDCCVHIWHFERPPLPAAESSKEADTQQHEPQQEPQQQQQDQQQQQQQPATQLVEFSCGGYQAKVTSTVFNAAGTMCATLGGNQSTVWDFTGPTGPAGSTPVVGLGHTKNLTCQAWQPLPDSPLFVTGGKDGRVLVYDVTEYADPPEDDMGIPKFAAPAAVAPDPDLKDEVTAVAWGISDPNLLYVAHASGELRCWRLELEHKDEH